MPRLALLAVTLLLALPGTAFAGGVVGYFTGPTFGVVADEAGMSVTVRASTVYPDAFQVDSHEQLFVDQALTDAGTCEEQPPTAAEDPWRYHCMETPEVRVQGGEGVDDVVVRDLGAPVTVDGGGGADVLRAFDVGARATISGGGGDDVVSGRPVGATVATAPAGVTLSGGDGEDQLVDALGGDTAPADSLDGGEGNDRLIVDGGGPGTYAGGGGADEAVVQDGDARLSLDGEANDGAIRPGVTATATLASDVETLRSGDGRDELRGGAGAQRLDSGGGDDLLVGGAGADELLAGPGADTLRARDGVRDVVSCGPDGEAAVEVDDVDALDGCEAVSSSDELQPDRDRDGVEAPSDCDDRNPSVKPGATEVPGNDVDENCDGVTADSPATGDPAPLPASTAAVSVRVRRAGRASRLVRLRVVRVPEGSTITVRCRARFCPRRGPSTRATAGTVDVLSQRLRRVRSRRRDRLTLIITSPAHRRRVITLTFRGPGVRPRVTVVDDP